MKTFFVLAFPSQLLFFKKTVIFFKLDFCSLIFAKPLYQKVRIDHRITFTFSQNSENDCNYKSDLGFWGFLGFSISLFILIIYEGNHFGDLPPPPPSPTNKKTKWTCQKVRSPVWQVGTS